MSTLSSLTYLRLNSEPNFRYCVVSHSGITIGPSAIPQFSVYENTGNTPVISWSGTTPRPEFTGTYSFSFKITGTTGFEVGKSYNVIASSYIFQRAKFDVVSTFIVGEALYDGLSGLGAPNYTADLSMIRSTGNVDRYVVQWRKNGVYVSGFVNPFLSLYNFTGGITFENRPMVKNTGVFGWASYTATGIEILSSGERYVAFTSGSFEGAVVSYQTIISRDYNL